jgi:hypothetical protein
VHIFKYLPMPENEFVDYEEKNKKDEISKNNILNEEVFSNLNNILAKLVDVVFNEFKIFNSQPTLQINEERKFDIFLSYRRHENDINEDIKQFRDRLIKSG